VAWTFSRGSARPRVTVARSTAGEDGAFAFRIPVACDEACDLRVDVYDAKPWRRRLRRHGARLRRILVRAADRAGNVATAAVTARVQRR
jgi:hypothetical protein